MTETFPLIITSSDVETAVIRRAFGSSKATIVTQGWSLAGLRASCIILTPGVDRNAPWFQIALMRFRKDMEVFVLQSEWHLKFMG